MAKKPFALVMAAGLTLQPVEKQRRILHRLLGVVLLLASVPTIAFPHKASADPAFLQAGQALAVGAKMLSPDGHYVLIMQNDGNLVEYVWPRPLWAVSAGAHPGTDLELQTDGNLVLYAPGHVAIWATNTAGNPGAYLALQNDANLTLHAANGSVLWTNGAVDTRIDPGQLLNPGWQMQSSDRRYTMLMQTDGNLVLYNGSVAIWASQTYHAGSDVEMQTDGNFVIYAPGHVAVWASNTGGHNNTALLGQTDGNFVLYAPGNISVWSTNTAPPSNPTNTLAGTIAQAANGQVGVKESPTDSNCNLYSAALGRPCEQWCADFVEYIWHNAHANTSGLTSAAYSFFIDTQVTHSNTPHLGDAAIFKTATSYHVGIVTAVSQTTITVVSGNWGNMVSSSTFNPAQGLPDLDSSKHPILDPVIGYSSPLPA